MATKFKCSDGIYTVLKNGLAVAIDATAGTAIAAISGSGTFTVIRNGKVIASSALAAAAVSAIVADAANVVCPPECCMTAEIALDVFDLTVTTDGDLTSLSVRVTITHNEDTYSTAWEAAAASNVFDLTTLIVDVGGWFSGDTICVEYSYDEAEIIEACCATVITEEYVEDDTYDLTELVGDCPFTQTSGFDLLYQNPDGGVTVSADGEMVVPDVDDDETVFVARNCNGCLTELLVLAVTDETPAELGLRLTYTPGNLPANNLAAWNAFFDLPANGTAFTSMSTAGDEVTLIGGAGITLKASLFRTSATLLKIEDDVDCVVAIAGGKNSGALSLCSALTTVTLNGVTTVGQEGLYTNAALTTLNMDALTTAGKFDLPALVTASENCFRGASATTYTLTSLATAGGNCWQDNTAAITLSLPALRAIGSGAFQGWATVTAITMPILTDLGGTTGNNTVFFGCTALTSVTVPTALATVDGGNHPDGDLVYADATLGATINYI